jgi:hypothetical protein
MQDDPKPQVVVVAAGDMSAVRDLCNELDVELVAQRSSGLSSAINEGWQLVGAGAQAWTWLGDDDELIPGSLTRTTAALTARSTASMVYGRCLYVNVAGAVLWTARPGRLARVIAPYGPNLIPQPGSLLRATAVSEVGMLDPGLRYAMDIDLFLKLSSVGDLLYLPTELAMFRWHLDSTTVANRDASDAELRMVQERHRPASAVRLGRVLRPAAQMVGRASYRFDRLRSFPPRA